MDAIPSMLNKPAHIYPLKLGASKERFPSGTTPH